MTCATTGLQSHHRPGLLPDWPPHPAAYDSQGALVGSLGPSSPDLLAALPLPLYMCWVQLLLMAAKLGQWRHARRAAQVLLPRFLTQLPHRPTWEAHPMDCLRLQQEQVEVAARPLLRALVQVCQRLAQVAAAGTAHHRRRVMRAKRSVGCITA